VQKYTIQSCTNLHFIPQTKNPTPKNTEPQNRANTAMKSPGEPKINVKNASKGELMRLPGIGNKLSDKIIAYRSIYGGFTTIGDLKSVKGIGV